jgi:proteasome lid subunit RPN8/RPN11
VSITEGEKMSTSKPNALPNKIPLPTQAQFAACGGTWNDYTELLHAHNIKTWAEWRGDWLTYQAYLEDNGVGVATETEAKEHLARIKADAPKPTTTSTPADEGFRCLCHCEKCKEAGQTTNVNAHCAGACCPVYADGTFRTSTGARSKKPSDTFTCAEGLEISNLATDGKGGCPIAAKGRVEMPHNMFRNWVYLASKYDVEWIAYLIGHQRPEDGCWIITDMYFPKQRCQGAHVEVIGDDQVRPNTIGSVHSHVAMDAFFSKEDIDHFNHPVELVVNRHSKLCSAILQKLECGRFTRIAAPVYLTGGSEEQVALETALNEQMSRPSSSSSHNYSRQTYRAAGRRNQARHLHSNNPNHHLWHGGADGDDGYGGHQRPESRIQSELEYYSGDFDD